MAVITINLGDEQIKKAQLILRQLRDEQGESVSRSEVFRLAIDALFLSMCHTDTSRDICDPCTTDIAA